MKVITQGLNKSYKDKKVLQDISFTIENNEIVAVLGPNGVGKTTSYDLIFEHHLNRIFSMSLKFLTWLFFQPH